MTIGVKITNKKGIEQKDGALGTFMEGPVNIAGRMFINSQEVFAGTGSLLLLTSSVANMLELSQLSDSSFSNGTLRYVESDS